MCSVPYVQVPGQYRVESHSKIFVRTGSWNFMFTNTYSVFRRYVNCTSADSLAWAKVLRMNLKKLLFSSGVTCTFA